MSTPSQHFTIDDAHDLVDDLKAQPGRYEQVLLMREHTPQMPWDWCENAVKAALTVSPEQLLSVITYADRTGEVACGFLPKDAAA